MKEGKMEKEMKLVLKLILAILATIGGLTFYNLHHGRQISLPLIEVPIPLPLIEIPIEWLLTPLIALILLLFVRFTIVEESTAKTIIRFGGIQKVFIQWVGYKLDEEGNVEEDIIEVDDQEKQRLKGLWLGGLRCWIGTPFDKVYRYRLRWHSIEEKEGKRVPVFHDQIKDYVMLRPDAYWVCTPKVETSDGQFPDVEWLVRMRGINPRKTIFKAPHDWVENALTVLKPLQMWYVQQKSLKGFLDLTTEQIWNDLRGNKIIQKVLKEEWGILIEEEGIEKFAVNLPKEYQEALAAKSKAEMEANALKLRAEVGAVGRAAEITGTVIESVAAATGMTKKQVQEEFQKDSKAFYEKHGTIIDNVMTKLSIEERAYLRIETPGAAGVLGDFLSLIAAWQRMPPIGKREKEDGGKSKYYSKEEINDIIRRAKRKE